MAEYRPSLKEARAAMDKPLDPDMEFDFHQKRLAEAERDGLISPLTSQERSFLSLFKMGLTWQQAARGAGMTAGEASKFLEDPRAKLAANLISEAQQSQIIVTKDLLTFQYYEAMSEAETAGEKIRGLDSVAKLHEIGGFARPSTKAEDDAKLIGRGLSKEAQMKKLSSMSADKLIELSAVDADFYDPKPVKREED